MTPDNRTKKMLTYELKIQRHRERKKELKFLIQANQESIASLYAFANGKETLKNKGYTRQAENYQRTPEDNKRLKFTVGNLNLQTALMKRELEVLQEYDN